MKIKDLSSIARKKLTEGWFLDEDLDINDKKEGFCPNWVHFFAWGWEFTPLTYAAHNGDLELVRELIEKGAEIDEPASSYTAIQLASLHGYHQVVSYLLSKGAKIDQTILELSQKKPWNTWLGFWQRESKMMGYTDIDKTHQIVSENINKSC
jgi:hypothetical protein